MSTKITNITNRAGKIVASIAYDADAKRWRISSMAESNLQQLFAREQDAFDFWHARFDPESGKLK